MARGLITYHLAKEEEDGGRTRHVSRLRIKIEEEDLKCACLLDLRKDGLVLLEND